MEMAIEARLTAMIIETDYIEVVNLANNITSNRKEIVSTILDIQKLQEEVSIDINSTCSKML